jgi:class 3 adenylate cyclase
VLHHICNVIGGVTSPDVSIFGPEWNSAWRLAKVAGANEALVSSRAGAAAELDISTGEQRILELDGVSEPFRALVL